MACTDVMVAFATRTGRHTSCCMDCVALPEPGCWISTSERSHGCALRLVVSRPAPPFAVRLASSLAGRVGVECALPRIALIHTATEQADVESNFTRPKLAVSHPAR